MATSIKLTEVRAAINNDPDLRGLLAQKLECNEDQIDTAFDKSAWQCTRIGALAAAQSIYRFVANVFVVLVKIVLNTIRRIRFTRHLVSLSFLVMGSLLLLISVFGEQNELFIEYVDAHNIPYAAKFFEHLGVALIVAVVIAYVFHYTHEKELLTQLLDPVKDKIEKVDSEMNEVSARFSRFNNIVKFAEERGITGAYNVLLDEGAWKQAVLEVVREAETFAYIEARTLRPFLKKSDSTLESGWLGAALSAKLSEDSNLSLAMILADTFDENSSYCEQLKLLFDSSFDQGVEEDGCRDAVEWVLNAQDELAKSLSQGARSDGGQRLGLRLLDDGPPIFLVMSDKSAVVGHYIPFKQIGCVRMLRLKSDGDLYQEYKDHFETVFAVSSEPAECIDAYVTRKREVGDTRTVSRWQPNQNIAEENAKLNSYLQKIVDSKREHFRKRDASSFLSEASLKAAAGARQSLRGSVIVDRAVVRTYQRGDAGVEQAIKSACEEASSFIYVLGRCHEKMLGQGTVSDTGDVIKHPWLHATLRQKLDQGMNLQVILPDTFTKDENDCFIGPYQKELEGIVKQKKGSVDSTVTLTLLQNQTRRTVEALIDLKISLGDSKFENLELKLTHEVPRACMLITDKRAFVEVYLPGQDGGACKIVELAESEADLQPETKSRSYTAFKDYFESLTKSDQTFKAEDVIKRYCDGHSDKPHRIVGMLRQRLEKLAKLSPDGTKSS